MTGAERITAERQRQIEKEGWTPEHDDRHDWHEMSDAAIQYIRMAESLDYDDHNVSFAEYRKDTPPSGWPWEARWWKPSGDPVRNLEKAGALIAAEIDRLQRRT